MTFVALQTHCDDKPNISIEGYKCFKICRSKSRKRNGYYGGITILYKESLQKGLKFLNHKNDYIWFRLCKHFFVVYISPENSSFYKLRGENTLHHTERNIINILNCSHCVLKITNLRKHNCTLHFACHVIMLSKVGNFQYKSTPFLP